MHSVNGPKFMMVVGVNFDENCVHVWNTEILISNLWNFMGFANTFPTF